MDIVGLLTLLLVVGLVIWAVQQIPLVPPLNWVIPVIIAIVLISWLLGGHPLIH